MSGCADGRQHWRRQRQAPWAWLAVVALIGVLAAVAATASAQTGPIEIASPWARATPGGATTAAIYMTITAPAGDRLVSVSTPAAKTAEMHTMTMTGGVAKMRELAAIDLPAGKPVALKPGGLHIMLLGLAAPLKPGTQFPLTLGFAKGGSRSVTVAVAKVGAMAPPDAMPMPH